MGFREIANSPLLYILVIGGLVYIVIYASIFLKRSYGRCLELGLSKESINNVIKSSLVFTVVPSISIVVGFFSLAAALGVPWPWWRLSVIGAVGYELMAADMAAKGMNYASLAAMAQANDPQVFGAVMYVMSIGILGGFFILLPFGKKMTTGLMKAREKEDNTWGILMSSCFFLTLVAVFMPIMLMGDKIGAATLLTSAAITLMLGFIMKKFNAAWLGNFVLAITLILSMIASVGWSALLN